MSNGEKVNWNEVNYKKESSMSWLNAMNNACLLLSNVKGGLKEKELLEILKNLRDEIYKLNMTKIEMDTAQNLDPEDLVKQ